MTSPSESGLGTVVPTENTSIGSTGSAEAVATSPASATSSRAATLMVIVAALGYFVDVFDLLLFSIVRVPSLKDLGVPAAELLDRGVMLINFQMAGMLLGGIAWGMLGDKRGRLSVLFGSILLYSLANIANGLVHDVNTYAVVRFLAGLGLAGELGAGITLVSEVLGRTTRGYGTTIVATLGLCGAVTAGLVGDLVPWRTAYFIGGVMGLALLALRVGVHESGLFERIKGRKGVSAGSFSALFYPLPRLKRYLSLIVIGLPAWFEVGILVTLAPEIGKALGLANVPGTGRCVLIYYSGSVLGDLLSGLLSQWFKSRKKIILWFLIGSATAIAAYFLLGGRSSFLFLACYFFMGTFGGYWAVFVTMASEQFGTNLRATVTTTTPNFVRGAVVPLTLAFSALKGLTGVTLAALCVGAATVILAIFALTQLPETYDRDLDFVED